MHKMNFRLKLGLFFATVMLIERLHSTFMEVHAADPYIYTANSYTPNVSTLLPSLNNKRFSFVPSTSDAPANALKDPQGNRTCLMEYDLRNFGNDRLQNVFGREINNECRGEVWGLMVRPKGQYFYVIAPAGTWLPFNQAMTFRDHPRRTPAVFIMNNDRGTKWTMAIANIDGVGSKTHLEQSVNCSWGARTDGNPQGTCDQSHIQVFVPNDGPLPLPDGAVNKNFQYIPSTSDAPANALKDPKGNLACAYPFDERKTENDVHRFQVANGYVDSSGNCLFEAWGARKIEKGAYYYVVAPEGKWVPFTYVKPELFNDQKRTPLLFQLSNNMGGASWKCGLCAIDGFGSKTHFDMSPNTCYGMPNGNPTGVSDVNRLQIYVPNGDPIKSPAEADPSSIFGTSFSFSASTQDPPANVVRDGENRPVCTFIHGKNTDEVYMGVIGFQDPQTKTCNGEAWGPQIRYPGEYHYLVSEGEWSRFHELTSDLLTDQDSSFYVYQMNHGSYTKWKVGASLFDKNAGRFYDLPGNPYSHGLNSDLKTSFNSNDYGHLKFFVPRPKTHVKNPADAYTSSLFNKNFQFAPSDAPAPQNALKDEKGNYICINIFDARTGGLGNNDKFISQFGFVNDKKQCLSEAWGVHKKGVGRWHYVIAPTGKWVPLSEVRTDLLNDRIRSPHIFVMDNPNGVKYATGIATIDGYGARHSELGNKGNAWGSNPSGDAGVGTNDSKRVKVFMPNGPELPSISTRLPDNLFGSTFGFASSAKPAPVNALQDLKNNYVCAFLYDERKTVSPDRYQIIVGHVLNDTKQCVAEAWGLRKSEQGEWEYIVPPTGKWVSPKDITPAILQDNSRNPIIAEMAIKERWKIAICTFDGLAGKTHMDGSCHLANEKGDGTAHSSDPNHVKVFLPDDNSHIHLDPAKINSENFSFSFIKDSPDIVKSPEGNPVCTTTINDKTLIGSVRDGRCYVNLNNQSTHETLFHYIISKGTWKRLNEISADIATLQKMQNSPVVFSSSSGSHGICSFKGWPGNTSLGGKSCTGVDGNGNTFDAPVNDSDAKVFLPDLK